MAIEEIQSDQPSRAFFALADPTRRAKLVRLADGEATVSELMASFTLSQPTGASGALDNLGAYVGAQLSQ